MQVQKHAHALQTYYRDLNPLLCVFESKAICLCLFSNLGHRKLLREALCSVSSISLVVRFDC